MKILVVTHSYEFNGAAAVLKLAMEYWSQKLAWKVDVFAANKMSESEEMELYSIGVEVKKEVQVPTDYQLVLINTLIDFRQVGAFFGHLPIVWWIHEGTTTLLNMNMTIPSLIDFFSKPNLVIFDSDWQASEVFRSFIYHLPKEKFVTAYCGARAATASVTRHTDLSTTLNVVNVGSVYGRKRQFDLASAVVELNRRYSLRCNFIGSLKYIHTFGETALPFMQQHVDALNFTDALTEAEKQNYLINADMACFPSGDETFNISAMEAANYGIPVILADLPVYEELGWRHGSNCLKYPVANVPALEKEIEKLVLDVELRQRLGDAGKALAEKFTVDAFLERITTLVESQKRSIV